VTGGEARELRGGPVNIVVALDRNVVHGCVVTVRSALENSSPGTEFRVYVMHDGLPPATLRALESSWRVDGKPCQVEFFDVQLSRAVELVRSKTLSRMSYARLLVGEILPATVSRVAYLDTDLLFELDVAELFRTDLGGKIVAAVPDGSAEWDREQFARLGVDGEHYFNAGLMLIDLDRWRRSDAGNRAVQFCKQAKPVLVGPFKFGFFAWDQDGLNTVLAGQVHYLPSRWNSWAVRLDRYQRVVIHLITGPKPWDADYTGMFGDRFFEYLDRTAFAGWRPPRLLGAGATLKKLRRKVPYPPTVLRVIKETLRASLRGRSAD
jgi:lipopolysaccharide biosynthesis glycosyltransferase